MELRPYQKECVESVFRQLKVHGSTLVVMATGCGKTATAAAAIGEWFDRGKPGRVLWLAHREELIQQAAGAISSITGLSVSIEMGDSHSFQDDVLFSSARATVASVQTLSRERRRKKFNPERFGLIITDEAHHSTSRSYLEIYRYFSEKNPDIKHLGLTATPNRSDRAALGKVFDSVAFKYEIGAAIDDGWLVPIRQAAVSLDGLDYSEVRTVGGDFNLGDLESLLIEPTKKIALQMARPIVEMVGTQQALVFTVSVSQAKMMCDYLNDREPKSAVWLSGETEKPERARIIRGFRTGEFQFLLNCAVLTEGFDAPTASWVVMARPTKSLSLYVQMLGRATRPLPGILDGCKDAASRRSAIESSPKPYATVLDFVDNSKRLGAASTISAVDVLGGNYDDSVREHANRRMVQEPTGSTVTRELEKAEAEIELFKEEDLRRARIIAQNQYRVNFLEEGVDPGPILDQKMKPRGEPATEKQIWKLCSLGVPRYKAERCTKKQATGWIGRLLGEK